MTTLNNTLAHVQRFYMKNIPNALMEREKAISVWLNNSNKTKSSLLQYQETYIPDVKFGYFATLALGSGEPENRFRIHEVNFDTQYVGNYETLESACEYLGELQYFLMTEDQENIVTDLSKEEVARDYILFANLWCSMTRGDDYVPMIINTLGWEIANVIQIVVMEKIMTFASGDHNDVISMICRRVFEDHAIQWLKTLVDSTEYPRDGYFFISEKNPDGDLMETYTLIDGSVSMPLIDPSTIDESMGLLTRIDGDTDQISHDLVQSLSDDMDTTIQNVIDTVRNAVDSNKLTILR